MNVYDNMKVAEGHLTCPYYCPMKRKHGDLYTDLYQHASGEGSSNLAKRCAKEKVNPVDLMQYLEKYLPTPDESYPFTSWDQNEQTSERTFTCPYCPKEQQRDYLYTDLVQHALGVGNSTSTKRSATEKANHLALMKQLQKDIANVEGISKPTYETYPLYSFNYNAKNPDGTYTCPCCPVEQKRDYLYKDLVQHASAVGNSNSSRRSAQEKADHLSLMKYLVTGVDGPSNPENDSYPPDSHDQKVKVSEGFFTCPCCPRKLKRGHYLYRDLLQHASGVGNSISINRKSKEKANHLVLMKCLEKYLPSLDGLSDPANAEYYPLISNDQNVKASEGTFSCPYCPLKENRRYFYSDLVQHASGVGKSCSAKRSPKEKADHLALTKCLEKYLSPDSWDHNMKVSESTFACPFCPMSQRRYVYMDLVQHASGIGNSDSAKRSANEKANHLALMKYLMKGLGSIDGPSEPAYDSDPLDSYDHDEKQAPELNTVSEIIDFMEEEGRKHDGFISNLTNIAEINSKHLQEIEQKCEEASVSINNVMREKERLLQSYNKEIRKFQQGANDHFQRIFKDHEKLKQQLESHEKELELRKAELEKRQLKNETERRMISEEISKNALSNSMLARAALEKKRNNEILLKLTEDHKREMDDHNNKIIELQKQLDSKQSLELEMEQIRSNVTVMEHIASEGDMEVLKKVDQMLKDLMDKERELEDLNAQGQTILMRELKRNEELQEARKELVNCLKDVPGLAHIRVRRMGELNSKPFHEAMRKRYNEEEAEERATELCSLWEEYLRDPGWHPFKNIEVAGKHERVIDEQNDRLVSLRNDLGEEVYKAVTKSLLEIVEYNPSGSYVTSVLWNYNEDRKATLKEGIRILLNEWETVKAKNKSPMY